VAAGDPAPAVRVRERRGCGHAPAGVVVVVLLRPGGSPPTDIGVYRIPGVGGDAFTFRYHVVPLWRLDARQMRAELGLEGAPFCAAMHGADEAFIRARSGCSFTRCSRRARSRSPPTCARIDGEADVARLEAWLERP